MKRSSGSDPERDRRRPAGSGHEDDAAVGSRSRLQGGKLSRKQLLHFTAILQVELIAMEACDAGVLPASFFRKQVTGVSFPHDPHYVSSLRTFSSKPCPQRLDDIAALPLHNLVKPLCFRNSIS